MPSSRPVALVTGAARRLGREIALDLAAHGFDVAVHCRTSVPEAQAVAAQAGQAGARAAVFQADLAHESQCLALVPQVLAHFGRLDAVVNNASIYEHDTAETFTMAAMEAHWRANTAPAVLLAQALHTHRRQLPAPPEADAACVVNLLDQKLENLHPEHFSYTLSKAALQAASVMLAKALAPWVRVCGVAPGLTLRSGNMSDQQFLDIQPLMPLNRTAHAPDIARAVRFMIESSAITGSTVVVDGGQHLQPDPRHPPFANLC